MFYKQKTMSYYQFQGAVQGGYGPGLFDDPDARRRKKHYRDAGAPYSGGITVPPSAAAAIERVVPVEQYKLQDIQPQAAAAPRMSAAVDLGSGPVQQMPESPADVPEQKRLAASSFGMSIINMCARS